MGQNYKLSCGGYTHFGTQSSTNHRFASYQQFLQYIGLFKFPTCRLTVIIPVHAVIFCRIFRIQQNRAVERTDRSRESPLVNVGRLILSRTANSDHRRYVLYGYPVIQTIIGNSRKVVGNEICMAHATLCFADLAVTSRKISNKNHETLMRTVSAVA